MKKIWVLCSVILVIFSLLSVSALSLSAETDRNDEAALSFINSISGKLPEFEHWQDCRIQARKALHDPASLDTNALIYELDQDGQACGYLIVDTTTQAVLEFSSGISPFRQYLDTYCRIKFADRPIRALRLVYCPGTYAIAVQGADAGQMEVIDFTHDATVHIDLDSISRMFLNDSLNETDAKAVTPLGSTTHYKLLSGVPDTNYYLSCIPTAIGNVIGYWDTHGYSNLIVYPATIYSAIAEVSQRMIDYCGNNTSNSAIPTATQGYCQSRYPGHFSVYNVWSPSYTSFTGQITYNRPALVGFASGGPYTGAHMTTGVGYYYEDGEPDKYVIVHDAWYPADDHYQLWGSYNDFIAKIIP